jgi:acetolactate synthase-1/2/3 large subunit
VAVEVPANLYLIRDEAGEDWTPPLPDVPTPDPAAVTSAAALLSAARRVLVYAGYGTRGATTELRELAERLGAPVATTIQGKGVMPEDHPLFLWNTLGRAAPAFVREVAGGCDAMLAVGCRFAEVGTASYGFTPPTNLVHVDIDPAVIGRNFPAAISVGGDAAVVLRALLREINPRTRDHALEAEIARGHGRLRAQDSSRSRTGKVTPAALFDALQQLTRRDAIFVTDSGNGTFLAMERLRVASPGQFLAPVDFSCMGYSVPAAIGAKLANPDREVIALAGDGALLMTGLELVTAAAYRAGVVVCVLRDGELAQIAQFQRTSLARATASVLHPYDLGQLASAVGAAFLAVEDDAKVTSTLQSALATARTGRPVVVEVAIDYSEKTHFTRGVVATNLWRLPWRERLRVLARAVARHLEHP